MSRPEHPTPEMTEAEDRAIAYLQDAVAEAENNGYEAALGWLSLAEERAQELVEMEEDHADT